MGAGGRLTPSNTRPPADGRPWREKRDAGAQASEKPGQERKDKQQLTCDSAVASQSPTLPIFGTAGTRGVRTAEEKEQSLKPTLWFPGNTPSQVKLSKGHTASN